MYTVYYNRTGQKPEWKDFPSLTAIGSWERRNRLCFVLYIVRT